MELEFANRTESLIDNGMVNEFIKEVLDPANVELVSANGMELITQVCSKGLNEVDEIDPNLTVWLDVLDYIVQHSNAKEAYVGLMEQSVVFAHTNKFIYLLHPIQVVFSKLPVVRASYIESILTHIQVNLKSYLEVPSHIKSAEWEGDEVLLIEEDPQMRRIVQAYNYCLKLITVFVDHYLTLRDSSDVKNAEPAVVTDLYRRECLLRNALVNLLGPPLVYFDLSWIENPKENAERKHPKIKTNGRIIAEKIMKLLCKIGVELPFFIEWLHNKDGSKPLKARGLDDDSMDLLSGEEDGIELDMLSVSTYLYLLIEQNVVENNSCMVFTPSFVFNSTLSAVASGFNEEYNMVISKAMSFANKLLYRCGPPNPVEIHGLKSDMIQTDSHKNFIEKIVRIIIFSKVRRIRQEGLETLRKYLWSFDGHGRYLLLVRAIDVIDHSGLVGYLIVQFKEFVREALYDPNASKEAKEYFLGEKLRYLLLSACTLQHGATTDLTDNSDRIISAINLVRYLLLTDGLANKSGFYSSMESIEKSLLIPLRTGLDYSKAHFEQELRQLQDSNPKAKSEGAIDSTVTVDGKELSAAEVPLKDKIASVQSALSVFDMMFSLVARVEECYNQVKMQRTAAVTQAS